MQPPPPPEAPEPAYEGEEPEGGPPPSLILEYRRLLGEQMQRETEALRLYEALPIQTDFHKSRSRARLLRGSNRSGKTLSTAIEVARAVTGRDTFFKYPEKDGRCYIIGRDEKHLGEVVYRKLFRAGAFRIIRDLDTGKFRSYRPWDPADAIRKGQSKPAPPLIPARYVKSVTWKSKSDNVPEKVILTTGWELDFFSSLGKPPRGSDLDLVWFDEEIVEGEWYPEMSSRLLDRAGRLIWGATPQTGTDRLFELHQRCEAEFEQWRGRAFSPDTEPPAREWLILLADNPHIDEAQKRELEASLSEDDAKVRIGGEFALEASKVYPEFNQRIHNLDYFDIPMHWTRYTVTDPGRQVCAVLFAAVPPEGDEIPGVGVVTEAEPYVLLYDELYIANCDAQLYGEKMEGKCQGQDFEAFIIDAHGSRLTDIGSGKTVRDQYSAALEEREIRSNRTGSAYISGDDDVKGRTEAVRKLLRVRREGQPTLLTVALKDKLPNFKYEIERYRYKRTNGMVTDVPEDRGRVHLMACVSYLASYGPKYVEPPAGRRAPRSAWEAFQRKLARKAPAAGTSTVNLGPPRRT